MSGNLRDSPHVSLLRFAQKKHMSGVRRSISMSGRSIPSRRVLSLDERERAGRFSLALPEDGFVAARGILRADSVTLRGDGSRRNHPLLWRSWQAVPVAEPCGAPGIQFNVSHAGDVALIAVTKGRDVGIDIEAIDSRAVSGSGSFAGSSRLTSRTRSARSPEAGRDRTFVVFWTRKEACIKASGLGLSFPLSSFDVSSDAKEPRVIVCGGEGDRYGPSSISKPFRVSPPRAPWKASV